MNKLLTSIITLAVSSVTASIAFAQDVKGDAKAAEQKIAMCIGCHGIKGYQASFPEVYKVPMISGQNAKYIVNALNAYKKGERKHPTMRGIAESLSDQDIADVAAYYEQHGKTDAAVPAPSQGSPELAGLDIASALDLGERIGLVTTLYVGLLALSSGIAPLFAHPMSDAIGWREGFMVWASVTVIALLPWLFELWQTRGKVNHDDTVVVVKSTLKLRKSPTAMAIALTLAISSINGYVVFAWLPPLIMGTSAVGPGEAGMMLAMFGLIGLPVSLVTPILAAKVKRTDLFLYVSLALFLVGYIGLLLVPTLPWLWLVFISAGPIIFPLTLVLINLRTKSTQASMQVSGFVQVVAYSIAIFGPFSVGLIREWTGSWNSVLIFLIIICVPLLALAPILGRGKFIEDEVG